MIITKRYKRRKKKVGEEDRFSGGATWEGGIPEKRVGKLHISGFS